jgi:hypothetical protein
MTKVTILESKEEKVFMAGDDGKIYPVPANCEPQPTAAELAAAQFKAHQEALRPKLQPVANTWTADRWVGTRGINPLNESERKLLEACEKDGVSFAEKKTRLLRMRADMSKLKPTKLSI